MFYSATRYAGLWGVARDAGRPRVWAIPVESREAHTCVVPVPVLLYPYPLNLACQLDRQCIVGTNPIPSPFSVRAGASSAAPFFIFLLSFFSSFFPVLSPSLCRKIYAALPSFWLRGQDQHRSGQLTVSNSSTCLSEAQLIAVMLLYSRLSY
jgi:hypothetical protein